MPARTLWSVAFAAALAACSAAQDNHLAAAQDAYAKQDYITAGQQAQAALGDDARNVPALALLARAQIAMGRGEAALATLGRLDRTGERPDDAALLAAEGHLQTGDTAATERLLRGQDSADSWRLRALAADMQGEEAAARIAFAQGRQAWGDRSRLHAAEASWYLARGDADGARPAVRRAQAEAPDRIETLYVTGRLAQLDGEHDLASRAFLAILDIAPLDRPALLGAIAELGALGRMDLLRPLVLRGAEAYPRDAEFLFLAARLKAEAGDWAGVRTLFQRNENLIADHPDSRALYAKALLEAGQPEQARAQIVPVWRQHPDNPLIARIYAEVLIETGQAAQAREVVAPLAVRADAPEAIRRLAARLAAR
ncbi:tetratricopeptide repeat protein [Aurantiacibacter spongiae]|nr:tetratricopeptide repeat protein [Aurantiacibacter spongiae]